MPRSRVPAYFAATAMALLFVYLNAVEQVQVSRVGKWDDDLYLRGQTTTDVGWPFWTRRSVSANEVDVIDCWLGEWPSETNERSAAAFANVAIGLLAVLFVGCTMWPWGEARSDDGKHAIAQLASLIVVALLLALFSCLNSMPRKTVSDHVTWLPPEFGNRQAITRVGWPLATVLDVEVWRQKESAARKRQKYAIRGVYSDSEQHPESRKWNYMAGFLAIWAAGMAIWRRGVSRRPWHRIQFRELFGLFTLGIVYLGIVRAGWVHWVEFPLWLGLTIAVGFVPLGLLRTARHHATCRPLTVASSSATSDSATDDLQ